jgi:hypothetical protein
MRFRSSALVLAFVVCSPAAALALTQPNGTPIPSQMGCSSQQPTGLAAVMACQCNQAGVCNIGGVCSAPGQCPTGQNATCETTLHHAFNDNTCIPSLHDGLDPWAEASTTPETFQPTCALTFTVASRGTAIFHDAFGWYNVTGSKPSPDDLHVMLPCDAPKGAQAVLDIQSDPAWIGGEVAFFIITPEAHGQGGTCAGGDCCATVDRLKNGVGYAYYSQREFNPDAAGAQSLIHLLVYDSHVTQAKFYFAWEDIFGGSNNDFTDLVTSVEGVECSGGGLSCDTGKQGACALGISECQSGALGCHDLLQPSAEQCNGVDDDCDGVVDDGATCPDPNDVCQNGRCVPNCQTSNEFDCPADLTCGPDGRCVDMACVGVTCPADKVCRGGQCLGSCDGLQCPHDTLCVNGQCLALCDGVSCAVGEVCRGGVCLPGCDQCGGVACGAGLACGTGGVCLDPSCPAGCPSGTYCSSGTCVDSCQGAVCPDGQECQGGRCYVPGTAPDAGPGGGDGGNGATGDAHATACGCRAGGAASGTGGFVAIAMLFGGALAARRRRARRSDRTGSRSSRP